jgi:hypothetical protein
MSSNEGLSPNAPPERDGDGDRSGGAHWVAMPQAAWRDAAHSNDTTIDLSVTADRLTRRALAFVRPLGRGPDGRLHNRGG